MWEVMAKIGAVTTPRTKRRTILSSITRFEKPLAWARVDLSHANAWIALPPRCVILRSAEDLSEWLEHPSLNRGMLGKTPSAVKPLAPRGTGSDGSRLHQRGNIPPPANEAPRCAPVSPFHPRSPLVVAMAVAAHGSSASPTLALPKRAANFGGERRRPYGSVLFPKRRDGQGRAFGAPP